MATATVDTGAELKRLQRRQQDLLREQVDLMARGESERLTGQPTSAISARLNELADELGGVLAALQEAEREHGVEAVRQTARDSEFQATLASAAAVWQPLIDLADLTARRRGQGVGLPALPETLGALVREGRAYVAALRRLAAVREEA